MSTSNRNRPSKGSSDRKPNRVSSLLVVPASTNPSGLDGSALAAGIHSQTNKIFDDEVITAGYESVPLLDIETLPRGGISFETKAVGRVQVCLNKFVNNQKMTPWSCFFLFVHSIRSNFFPLYFIQIFSLEYPPKRSKTVCYWEWKSQLSTLFL
jgi:hypothetical protein